MKNERQVLQVIKSDGQLTDEIKENIRELIFRGYGLSAIFKTLQANLIMDAVAKHKTQRKAAKSLKIAPGVVDYTMKKLRRGNKCT